MQFRLWLENLAIPPGFKKLDAIHWTCPPMPVPEGIKRMYVAFKQAGFEFLIAGGAVRDHVRGEKPKDLDLATSATPNEVKKILDNNDFERTEEVGEQFGVVIAKVEGKPYEIATFRIDKEAGRQTEVEFIRSAEQDAARRDLTMNAMFYDIGKNQIIDYVGGVEDILNGKARPVGDPMQRFGEDPLRVLRLLRFHTRFNKNPNLDDDVINAIRTFTNNGLMDKKGRALAPERIRDEFQKGLRSAKVPVVYLQLFDRLGLLRRYVLPGFKKYNTNFINSRDAHAVIASILKYNTLDEDFQAKLKAALHENADVNKVLYYLKMLNLKRKNLRPDVVSSLIDKSKPQIPGEELAQYARWFHMPLDMLQKIQAYRPKEKLSDIPGALDMLQTLKNKEQEEKATGKKTKGALEPINKYVKGYNVWKALQGIGRMPTFGEWFRAVERLGE